MVLYDFVLSQKDMCICYIVIMTDFQAVVIKNQLEIKEHLLELLRRSTPYAEPLGFDVDESSFPRIPLASKDSLQKMNEWLGVDNNKNYLVFDTI